MENEKGILSLAESMELTMDKSNLSVVGDIGEVIIDAAMDDGIFKDIPVIGAIVGAGKCIKNVSDVLFTKKLIAFLFELRDTDVHEREKAIAKWESDEKYRIRVGEVLLNMINRCDDTQKAKWLSQLFHELVLKRNETELFMRAEKVLSSLSVTDILNFLALPQSSFTVLSLEEGEPYANSGLYRMEPGGLELIEDGGLKLTETIMCISIAGKWIYMTLNGFVQPETK
jgi:hypothetical protein